MSTAAAGERAILVGTDTMRLLKLATELEARGLDVAVFRDLGRGLAECAAGRCTVLVALGQSQGRATDSQPVTVPLVLIDVPEPAALPIRPLGPRTILPGSISAETAADRIVALLAARVPRAPEAATRAPPVPAETGAGGRSSELPKQRERAVTAPPATGWARASRRRWITILRWAVIVVAGLTIGYFIGTLWLNSTMPR